MLNLDLRSGVKKSRFPFGAALFEASADNFFPVRPPAQGQAPGRYPYPKRASADMTLIAVCVSMPPSLAPGPGAGHCNKGIYDSKRAPAKRNAFFRFAIHLLFERFAHFPHCFTKRAGQNADRAEPCPRIRAPSGQS